MLVCSHLTSRSLSLNPLPLKGGGVDIEVKILEFKEEIRQNCMFPSIYLSTVCFVLCVPNNLFHLWASIYLILYVHLSVNLNLFSMIQSFVTCSRIHRPWLGRYCKVSSGRGLSYLSARHALWAGGPVRQPYARVDFISPVRVYEFGYWSVVKYILTCRVRNFKLLKDHSHRFHRIDYLWKSIPSWDWFSVGVREDPRTKLTLA